MIEIRVKSTTGAVYELEVDAEQPVEEVKKALVAHSGIAVANQRLVYSGRILKDSELLSSYGVKAGHTIHLAASAPAATPSTSTTPTPRQETPTRAAPRPQPMPSMPGMPNMSSESMRAMMDSPMMRSLMDNPETMRAMMQSHPSVRRLMETNPEIASAMMNPETMRTMMRAASNPNYAAELQRQQDRAFANIESLPGGFNHLQRFFHDIDGDDTPASQDDRPDVSNNPFAALLETDDEPVRNNEALPNPWQAGGPTPARAASTGAPAGVPSNPFLSLLNPSAAAARPEPEEDLYGVGESQPRGQPAMPMPPFPSFMPSSNPAGGSSAVPGGHPLMSQALDPNSIQAAESMLDNPMFASMMENMTANPEMLQSLIMSNPILANNPAARQQVEAELGDPERLRSLFNPDTLRSSLNLMRSMSGQQPAATPQQPSQPTQPSQPPQAQAGGAQAQYRLQLQQLANMGFEDESVNLQALQATNGNVHAAVQRILDS